jgi:outer membrane protein assembly factor BamB
VGGGLVGTNPGTIRASFNLGEATLSSPIIGLDDTVYVGTGNGLIALHDRGSSLTEFWRFTGYRSDGTVCSVSGTACFSDRDCSDGEICTCACDPANEGCNSVGSISATPAVTIEKDLAAATDGGRIFALRDIGDGRFACKWIFPPPLSPPLSGSLLSSPVLMTDSADGSLVSVILGTPDGRLLALNGDGSVKWSFPATGDTLGALSSSPALGGGQSILFSAPDGFLYALDFTGRQRWRYPTGASQAMVPLLPSPSVSAATYTVGSAGVLFAVNPDGTEKWRFAANAEISTSPGFVNQTFENVVIEDEEPNGDETMGPTPTPTPEITLEVIVYTVDERGTVYGVRDEDGTVLRYRDSEDVVHEARVNLPEPASGVVSSPAISSDFFVIFGTDDGFLYARRFDGGVPCDPSQCSGSNEACTTDADCDDNQACEVQDECADNRWSTCSLRHCAADASVSCEVNADCTSAGVDPPCDARFCSVDEDCPLATSGESCQREGRLDLGSPIRSSPALDTEGTIFVTTDDGFLYAIGTTP